MSSGRWAILRGERGERNDLVGDVDALPLGEPASHFDAGDGVAVVAALDFEAQLAVIQEERQAGFQDREDFGMRQAHPLCGARSRIEIEPKGRAFHQRYRAARERPDSKLGALQVEQNADRPAGLRLDRADRLHPLAMIGRSSMTEIQAENVDAPMEQRMDHRWRGARRAECRDDLGVPLTAHAVRS